MNRKEKIKRIIQLLNPDRHRIEPGRGNDSMYDYYIYLYYYPEKLTNVPNYFEKEIRMYHDFEMFLQDLFFKNERVAFMIKELQE